MIDVSHANSGKRPENQTLVVEYIAAQIEGGETHIIGVMVESHLVAGRQDLIPGQPMIFGQSITDGCIDWDSSVQVLERLALAVRRRRRLMARNEHSPRSGAASTVLASSAQGGLQRERLHRTMDSP
jgi:3-deoxy-7-phosphoheptulonate synthase